MSQEKIPQPKGGYVTTGWRAICSHTDAPTVPCVVLDPFSGSGTVAVVARKAGRRASLIDVKPEYCEMAVEHIRQGVLL
jgi:methylase of polypeptide subunit release factors